MDISVRRETQDIIKKLNMGDEKLSRLLSVSYRTIIRWRKGISNPQAIQFERLKQLASGTLEKSQPVQNEASRILLELPGRWTQLTAQVAMIQESIGQMRSEIAILKQFHESQGSHERVVKTKRVRQVLVEPKKKAQAA